TLVELVTGQESPLEIFEILEYPGSSLDFIDHQHLRKPSAKLSKKDILRDKDKRISPEFHIPEPIYKRTAFWYDVYTKYSNTHHVFHHRDYPWIIFGVVDTAPIMKDKSVKNKWTRYHRAEKRVKEERNKIRKKLQALAKKDL